MAVGCDVFGVPKDVVEWCARAPKIMAVAQEHFDALVVAGELGRLDALTFGLTLFSIIIAVLGLVGLWFYRGMVDARATDEVRDRLPMLLDEHLRRNPGVFADALRKNAGVLAAAGFNLNKQEEDFSEEIAQAMGEEPTEEEKN